MQNKKRVIAIAAVLAAMLLAFYLASPLLAAHRLKSAAAEGDAEQLEQLIDFPAVREGLKGQLNALMLKSAQADPTMSDNPFAGLATLMLPAIVDRAVDAYVTPEAISAMMMQGKANAEITEAPTTSSDPAPTPAVAATPRPQRGTVTYAYRDLNTFRISSGSEDEPKAKVEFVLRRQGLFGWRMTRINLPVDLMAGSSAATQ